MTRIVTRKDVEGDGRLRHVGRQHHLIIIHCRMTRIVTRIGVVLHGDGRLRRVARQHRPPVPRQCPTVSMAQAARRASSGVAPTP